MDCLTASISANALGDLTVGWRIQFASPWPHLPCYAAAMRMFVALCLMFLIIAMNGGALTLAKSFGDGASAPSTMTVEWSSTQTVLEDCCDVEPEKVLPRSVTPCAGDCSALIPAASPTLMVDDAQGGWISARALTESPCQIWQRPPRA